MSKLSELAKSALHSVYEEDPTPATKIPAKPLANVPHPAFNITPGSAAAPAPAFTPTPGSSPFAVPTTTVIDEKVYKSIFAKTDFDNTPVGKILHGYYDGLEDMDPSTRFKTAFKLAAKRDGVTADQVLAAFDQLQQALEADNQQFTSVCAQHDKTEIQSRQTSIASKQQQVAQLNQEIAQLTTELADETSRSTTATTQHSLAQQRRSTEIAQQKASFASLLQ